MEYIGNISIAPIVPVAIYLIPVAIYLIPVAIILPPTPPIPQNVEFLEFIMSGENGFCKNHHIFTCTGQSATTKVTVWTMGSYQDFGKKRHLEGKLF